MTEASLSTFDDCSESFDFKNSFGREPTISSYSKDIKMEAHYKQNDDSIESNQIYSITTEPVTKQAGQGNTLGYIKNTNILFDVRSLQKEIFSI